MRIKAKLCIFFLVSFVQLCFAQEIKYVHNDKSLWRDKPQVALVKKLEIGGVDVEDENYMFYNAQDVIINNKGQICVVDGGNNRIQVYSSKGKYLRTIGRVGQGPGEFEWPNSIDQDENGNFVVNSAHGHAILVLLESGDELKRIIVERSSGEIRFLTNGDIVVSASQASGVSEYILEPGPLFKLYDQNGKIISEFLECDPIAANSSGRTIFISMTGIHFDTYEEFIYYSSDLKNIIRKVNSQGNVLLEISRKLNYDIEEYGIERKGNKYYYSNVVSRGVGVDGKGRIWVCTFKSQVGGIDMNDRDNFYAEAYGISKEHCVFEIYNTDGVLLGEVPLPIDMWAFRIQGDKLLALDDYQVSVHVFNIVENPKN